MTLAHSQHLTPEIIADACGNKKRSGDGFVCTCPVKANHTNGDKKPSFAVYYKKDGNQIGTVCHAGCTKEQINAALDMLGVNPYKAQELTTSSAVTYGELYEYADWDGIVRYTKQRKSKSGERSFEFKHYDDAGNAVFRRPKDCFFLYNLPNFLESKAMGLPVFFVEGEKDCDTLLKMGYAATTLDNGASSQWKKDFDKYFKPDDKVVVLHDEDAPGLAYANRIAVALKALGVLVYWVDLPGLEPNSKCDITDWFRMGHTDEEFISLYENAPEFSEPIVRSEAEAEKPASNIVSIDKKKPVSANEPTDADMFEIVRRWSHFGNVDRFLERYGSKLRYNWQKKQWLWYDNEKGYFVEAESQVNKAATQEMHLIPYADYQFELEIAKRKAWHKKCMGQTAIVEMLKGVSSEVAIDEQELDKQSHLFNVKNGVLDLKTMNLLPHSPDLLLSKASLDVTYDPSAECPTWDKFIAETFKDEPEKQLFVQRAAGYTLGADISAGKAFILLGNGRNGKSLFVEILAAALGMYAFKAEGKFFEVKQSRSHDENLSQMEGYRMFWVDEWNEKSALDTGRFKSVVTSYKLPARNLFVNKNYEFVNRAKLWFTTNHFFEVSDASEGPWRRMSIIRCNNLVEKEDEKLREKLLAELPGILNWLLVGYQNYLVMGLAEPQCVIEEREQFKEEGTPIRQFILDCIEPGEHSYTAGYLHQIYTKWCQTTGYKPKNPNYFGRDLKSVWKHLGSKDKRTRYCKMNIREMWKPPTLGDDFGD